MIVRVEGVQHRYAEANGAARPVLNIPVWTWAAGSQTLLRGVSGSGKTTLFNILAGLLRPTGGAVVYDDLDLYAAPEGVRERFRARAIGYSFQSHHLLAALTAWENVLLPFRFAGRKLTSAERERAADLLEKLGLRDHQHRRPHQLSTGQRLRVAIARALVVEPRLLLADEPTAALDHASAAPVMTLMQTFCREHGATLIVASHDPAWADRFPTILDLHEGRLSAASHTVMPQAIAEVVQ